MQKTVKEYERKFRKAGLPLLIEEYSASEDIFTRAAPLLSVLFVLQMFNALNDQWTVLANLAAVLGGFLLLALTNGLVNTLRGRSFFSLPASIGRLELSLFVLAPAALPLIFGGQFMQALLVAGVNLTVLLLVYLTYAFGLLSITVWVFRRLLQQLSVALSLLARAIPLLLIFTLVLFINMEVWLAFSTMPTSFFFLVVPLLFLFGYLFIAVRLKGEVHQLEEQAVSKSYHLTKLQRLNVGIVMFISQAMQVLLVSIAVGLFFLGFGMLVINPEIRVEWGGGSDSVLFAFDLLGERLAVTSNLLRVCGGISAVAGLYFSVSLLMDSAYRSEFQEEIAEEMRETFDSHAEYLKLYRSGSAT